MDASYVTEHRLECVRLHGKIDDHIKEHTEESE
jgi:hypothetical protein